MSFWGSVGSSERRLTNNPESTPLRTYQKPLATAPSSPRGLTRANRSFAQLDPSAHDRAADEIADGLLALNTDDDEVNFRQLRQSLQLGDEPPTVMLKKIASYRSVGGGMSRVMSGEASMTRVHSGDIGSRVSAGSLKSMDISVATHVRESAAFKRKVSFICCLTVMVITGVVGILLMGEIVVGPPRQPAGPYRLVERQVGEAFWESYVFYEGPDSLGSNGYINYVSEAKAFELGIAKIITEPATSTASENEVPPTSTTEDEIVPPPPLGEQKQPETPPQSPSPPTEEKFIYMASSPTPEGPRNSVRLEGKRRFNRGLFIMDLTHMPSGCGTWPAFWLTDEQNWPVNGEIDILEGVNFQTRAKTALHSTRTCEMDDVPQGVRTGTWDTAVGIPDRKTGVPDMTMRYATDCFVYNPHQWLNQGCVAVDDVDGQIGEPFNANGGGVYALEWDPINRHIRSWVFTPHAAVPDNLKEAIRTNGMPVEDRVDPKPNEWGLPYGYFAVGDDTSCPSSHFKNMRLVINLALCGSVSGNRYFMDCPKQFKQFPTCNQYIKSNPKELEEAYWKIRGVYVYERQWEKVW
eukprot:CAMPEP_0172498058 /NCGR_PEP_ID=MMETSP1066-20121228/108848_1 /TAXON_ID=671091 /ORGANISM="Coscinodiscus wailesii, Strain CCMP2513" /LENGTH=578 /DNA_ID=CAMNT_0013271175 /DNA_START=37 /DNA_END=1770 /DNA_ORIENTATION=+